jgi:hypothetical protein
MFRQLIFATVAVAAAAAAASPASAAGAGATVMKDVSCFAPSAIAGTDLTTSDTTTVVTPSGRIRLTCRFDYPAGQEPRDALNAAGFLCAIFTGDEQLPPPETFNTRYHASRGGSGTLSCVI